MTLSIDEVLPEAQGSVRSLELAITKRLEGMLHGDHRGVLPGPGWESGEGRQYQLGDDVRRGRGDRVRRHRQDVSGPVA